LHLQSALAEFDGEGEGLLARHSSATMVSCDPEYPGHPGEHPSQPSPVVERPGQSFGLT
jgi:hypothetical protein